MGESRIERVLRTMQDSVESLTVRVEDSKRYRTHNPGCLSFKEKGGSFIRTITQTVRSNTTKPLKLSYSGDCDPHLFFDSFKSHTNAKGYSDSVCCNMFPETLAGEALSWSMSTRPIRLVVSNSWQIGLSTVSYCARTDRARPNCSKLSRVRGRA